MQKVTRQSFANHKAIFQACFNECIVWVSKKTCKICISLYLARIETGDLLVQFAVRQILPVL